MEYVFAIVGMMILFPILYFIPTGYSAKGTFFMLVAALSVALMTYISSFTFMWWQSILILILMSFLVTILISRSIVNYQTTGSPSNEEVEADSFQEEIESPQKKQTNYFLNPAAFKEDELEYEAVEEEEEETREVEAEEDTEEEEGPIETNEEETDIIEPLPESEMPQEHIEQHNEAEPEEIGEADIIPNSEWETIETTNTTSLEALTPEEELLSKRSSIDTSDEHADVKDNEKNEDSKDGFKGYESQDTIDADLLQIFERSKINEDQNSEYDKEDFRLEEQEEDMEEAWGNNHSSQS